MMMHIKDMTGVALDWAVARCEGEDVAYINDGITRCLLRAPSGRYSPSTDWAQGGPIIEREKVGVWPSESIDGMWAARPDHEVYPERLPPSYGSTPLIAAMRCYVAAKLADDLDIPKELT